MEKLYKFFKEIIQNEYNDKIQELNDKGESLPLITDKSITFGTFDLQKQTDATLISFYPETTETQEEYTCGDVREAHKITISIVTRKAPYEMLISRICKYTQAFKETFLSVYSMNGASEDLYITQETYYLDCGTVEKQATGVEIEMTIYTERNYIS